MSRRQRMRRRRARGGHGGRIVAFSFGIVLVLLAIGALSGVAYILTIAADAPDIDTLKPVDKGAVSQVYAADGRRLGFIESTDLRTPLPDRMIPVEAKHSKRWILDKYLNSVSYGTVGGQSAVGLQAASRLFFDKPASRLTLDEAALLAGLPQAPSRYNPF